MTSIVATRFQRKREGIKSEVFHSVKKLRMMKFIMMKEDSLGSDTLNISVIDRH